ncbi:MAG: hypothetical protein WA799_03450 [Nitrosotalea sp.]
MQKRFAYKYKEKEHYKNVITVSEDILDKLGWKEGIELEEVVRGDNLIIKAKKEIKNVKSR